MSHEDDFQKLIDAIWAERDQGRGVRRALAEHPDLWPLVVDLGLEGYAEEVEGDDEVEREAAQDAVRDVAEDDDGDQHDHDARAVAPELAARARGSLRRGVGIPTPGFKPSRARRTFAGSVVNRPGVVASSGRAAID